MDWFFYSLIGLLAMIAYGLISKRVLNEDSNHDPIAFASVLYMCIGALGILIYLLSGPVISDFNALSNPEALKVLCLDLFFYTAAPSLYYRVLKNLPMSEVGILYSPTSVFIMIFSVISGRETFILKTLLGGILVIVSTVMVLISKKGWKINKYVILMFIATILYALQAMTDKTVVDHRYFSNLFFQIIIFAVPSFLLLIVNPHSIKNVPAVFKKSLRVTILNAAFFFLSIFAIFKAYSLGGNASAVNIILAAETIGLVFLSAIFLKETQDFKKKLIAGTLASIGVFLVR